MPNPLAPAGCREGNHMNPYDLSALLANAPLSLLQRLLVLKWLARFLLRRRDVIFADYRLWRRRLKTEKPDPFTARRIQKRLDGMQDQIEAARSALANLGELVYRWTAAEPADQYDPAKLGALFNVTTDRVKQRTAELSAIAGKPASLLLLLSCHVELHDPDPGFVHPNESLPLYAAWMAYMERFLMENPSAANCLPTPPARA